MTHTQTVSPNPSHQIPISTYLHTSTHPSTHTHVHTHLRPRDPQVGVGVARRHLDGRGAQAEAAGELREGQLGELEGEEGGALDACALVVVVCWFFLGGG